MRAFDSRRNRPSHATNTFNGRPPERRGEGGEGLLLCTSAMRSTAYRRWYRGQVTAPADFLGERRDLGRLVTIRPFFLRKCTPVGMERVAARLCRVSHRTVKLGPAVTRKLGPRFLIGRQMRAPPIATSGSRLPMSAAQTNSFYPPNFK